MIHKVAIECKFTERAVEKSKVTDFHSKLSDIENIQGVMITLVSYKFYL